MDVVNTYGTFDWGTQGCDHLLRSGEAQFSHLKFAAAAFDEVFELLDLPLQDLYGYLLTT